MTLKSDTDSRSAKELESDHDSESESSLSQVSDDARSGEEESESEPEETSSGRASRNKAVSAAEVRAAREASDTFRSNVFKLQVEEVLKEIAIDDVYSAQARKLLFSLREKIVTTKAVGPLSFKDAQKALTTRIPYPTDTQRQTDQGSEIKYKLGFTPPQAEDINVIGSWSLRAAVRRPSCKIGIDLLVTMDPSLFEPKDHLNFRYHRKKAFYLAVLASQLAEAGLPLEPRFENFNGHHLKPTLQLVPTGQYAKLGKRVAIYIHTAPAPSAPLQPSKLHPDRNANRQVEGPTPVYNWSILSDICALPLLKYLHEVAASTPSFGDAARLGALWLQQRRWGSSPSNGGFGSFEFKILLASLLNGGLPNGKKRLMSGYSSYQLFKGVLQYIAENEHISLETSTSDKTTNLSSRRGLLFTDYGLDVLANFTPWTSRLLRHDAQVSVDLLNDSTIDRFEYLFLRDCSRPHLRFDIDFEIPASASSGNQSPSDMMHQLHDILYKAWGPRYRAMQITPASSSSSKDPFQSSWPLSSDPPSPDITVFNVGVLLNPDASEKRVTFVGPEFNNDPNVFKSFWGPKAGLRRFQDGSIKDAVVWSPGIRPIALDAAVYAITRHLDLDINLPPLLERKLPQSIELPQMGSGFLTLQSSFQKLGQALQDLRALPLRILSVYGTSAELRSASIIEPKPFDPTHIAEGIIEMETSSRWPSEVEAIEKVKSAFIIKIAEMMRQSHPQYYVVVGVEPSPEDPSVEAAFAVVQTPDGYYIKLRLVARTPRSVPTKLIELADHSRLISTMVNRYPRTLSTTMRMVKFWLERQMLMGYITEPAAELLTLHVFANSAPWAPPASPTTAFWRVLDLLSRWDWRESNLVIDVDSHIESTEHHIDQNRLATGCDMDIGLFQQITSAFSKQRKQDAALTEAPWSISTKLDYSGVKWTKWEPRSRLAPMIASRVTALSRAAKPGMKIFDVSLNDFDVAWNVKTPAMSSTKKKNIVVSDPHKAIIESHDVALDLVRALTKLYKDTLVLFYSGSLGTASSKGATLCGLWNKQASEPITKLKASISYPVRKTKNGEFELNKDAVIMEIERLGEVMLERIK